MSNGRCRGDNVPIDVPMTFPPAFPHWLFFPHFYWSWWNSFDSFYDYLSCDNPPCFRRGNLGFSRGRPSHWSVPGSFVFPDTYRKTAHTRHAQSPDIHILSLWPPPLFCSGNHTIISLLDWFGVQFLSLPGRPCRRCPSKKSYLPRRVERQLSVKDVQLYSPLRLQLYRRLWVSPWHSRLEYIFWRRVWSYDYSSFLRTYIVPYQQPERRGQFVRLILPTWKRHLAYCPQLRAYIGSRAQPVLSRNETGITIKSHDGKEKVLLDTQCVQILVFPSQEYFFPSHCFIRS